MWYRSVALAFLTVMAPQVASAGTIDLRSLPGNFNQAEWGQPNTTLYAQSVIADDSVFTEARFLADPVSGALLFNFMITGDRADGGGGLGFAPDFSDIRYNSGPLSIADGSGLTEIQAILNLAVTPGERLFLVLDTYSYPLSGIGTVLATQFQGTDQYLPGEFVFLNTFGPVGPLLGLNALNWEHRFAAGEDLAIYANFASASVPEPTSLLLLATGVAGLIATGRRRKNTGV